MTEDDAKHEALRLLWDGEAVEGCFSRFLKANQMMTFVVNYSEIFDSRTMRLEGVRIQATVCPATKEVKPRWMVARLRKFCQRVMECQPKLALRNGEVVIDFLARTPKPLAL